MLAGNIPWIDRPRNFPVFGGNDQFTKMLFQFEDAPIGAATAFASNAAGQPTQYSIAVTNGGKNDGGGAFTGSGAALDTNFAGSYAAVQQATNDLEFGGPATADFSIDWWEYRVNVPVNSIAIARDSLASYQAFLLGYGAAGNALQVYMSSTGSSWDIANAVTMGTSPISTWTHYAVGRLFNQFGVWQNGILTATWAHGATLLPAPSALMGLGMWNGSASPILNSSIFYDQLRISKGICRWTPGANFPVRQFAPYDGVLQGGNDVATKCLLHFDGNVNDSCVGASPHTFTLQSSAQLITSDYVFGGGSLKVGNTTTDRITTPNSADFDFTNQPFSIDMWVKRLSPGTSPCMFITKRNANTDFAPFLFYDDGTALKMYGSSNNTAWDIASNVTIGSQPPLNQWCHIAFVRFGNLMLCFVNGQISACQSFAGTVMTNTAPLVIGGESTGASAPYQFDEIRISKGTSRWIENFYRTLPQGY